MLTSLLLKLGVQPQAVAPTIAAFIKSQWYTASSVVSLFFLLALTNGGSEDWHKGLAWMSENWWPFVVAQLIAPFLRSHAAVNLYSTPGPASQDPKTT